jgi:hypothetical protein
VLGAVNASGSDKTHFSSKGCRQFSSNARVDAGEKISLISCPCLNVLTYTQLDSWTDTIKVKCQTHRFQRPYYVTLDANSRLNHYDLRLQESAEDDLIEGLPYLMDCTLLFTQNGLIYMCQSV